jgi:hypothetical protein
MSTITSSVRHTTDKSDRTLLTQQEMSFTLHGASEPSCGAENTLISDGDDSGSKNVNEAMVRPRSLRLALIWSPKSGDRFCVGVLVYKEML